MNKAIIALNQRLTFGEQNRVKNDDFSHGFIETFAKAYEKARNALEYRAENLVRRAAIERILKRLIILNKNPDVIAENLLTELKWARYLLKSQITEKRRDELAKILKKYIAYSGRIIPNEWITKIASAEIEEFFNLNTDYNQFTFFAFQVLKQKILVNDENLDLITYFATDKIYAGSDLEQIAYHIISLAGKDLDTQKMEEGWKLFELAHANKLLPKISKFVRRQMPPLILLRDIYFYTPNNFKSILSSDTKFIPKADEVLDSQLSQMSEKIATAGVRSVVYVFLTKMALAFGIETPLEILIYGKLEFLPLIVNLIFPPLLMWIATMQIKVPSKKERENLIQRTWYLTQNFENLKDEDDCLVESNPQNKHGAAYWIFSTIYAFVFIGIFILIFYILGLVGYKLFSKMIFIFFLTIIAFFAYRIVQVAKVYSWKNSGKEQPSIGDMISLPILTIGSILSQGLTKINFLGFIFDFILEAPFKIILGFLDDWVQFLSTKKEEQILD